MSRARDQQMAEYIGALELDPSGQNYWLKLDQALELIRIAGSLNWLNEAACNYGLTGRQEKRVARLEARASEIANTIGATSIRFNSDPRGYPIGLALLSGRRNCDYDDWLVPL